MVHVKKYTWWHIFRSLLEFGYGDVRTGLDLGFLAPRIKCVLCSKHVYPEIHPRYRSEYLDQVWTQFFQCVLVYLFTNEKKKKASAMMCSRVQTWRSNNRNGSVYIHSHLCAFSASCAMPIPHISFHTRLRLQTQPAITLCGGRKPAMKASSPALHSHPHLY